MPTSILHDACADISVALASTKNYRMNPPKLPTRHQKINNKSPLKFTNEERHRVIKDSWMRHAPLQPYLITGSEITQFTEEIHNLRKQLIIEKVVLRIGSGKNEKS